MVGHDASNVENHWFKPTKPKTNDILQASRQFPIQHNYWVRSAFLNRRVVEDFKRVVDLLFSNSLKLAKKFSIEGCGIFFQKYGLLNTLGWETLIYITKCLKIDTFWSKFSCRTIFSNNRRSSLFNVLLILDLRLAKEADRLFVVHLWPLLKWAMVYGVTEK